MKLIEEMWQVRNLIRIFVFALVLFGCEANDSDNFNKVIGVDQKGRIHEYMKYDSDNNLIKSADLIYYNGDTSLTIKNFPNQKVISEIEYNSQLSSLNQLSLYHYDNDQLTKIEYYDLMGNHVLTLCYEYQNIDPSKSIQIVYNLTDSGFVAIDSILYSYNEFRKNVKLESFNLNSSEKYYQELTQYIDDTLISERSVINRNAGSSETQKYFYNTNKQLVEYQKLKNGKLHSIEKTIYKNNLVDSIVRTSNVDTLYLKYYYK